MKMNSSELIEKLSRENEILRLIIELMDKKPQGWEETVKLLRGKVGL